MYGKSTNVNYQFTPHQVSDLLRMAHHDDVTGLRESDITLADLDQLDGQQRSLMDHINRLGDQILQDRCYGLVRDAFAEMGASDAVLQDQKGRTLLHWAAKTNQPAEVINQLIADGIPVDHHQNAHDVRPLYCAAQGGNLQALTSLLARGAQVNASAKTGATALHVACETSDVKTVQALLDAGADANAQCAQHSTPLFVAAMHGRDAIIELLLESGVLVNVCCTQIGATPLFAAAAHGHTETVTLLMSFAADVNTAIASGATPLDAAIQNKHNDVVTLLKEAGAISQLSEAELAETQ